MTVFSGLPTHVLFVHFLVVLVPLTALLEILCAVRPAVRRGQIVWLTLALATVIMVLTPITVEAGEWLYDLRRNPDPILQQHAERGGWMTYFAVALLVVAVALAALNVAERRSDQPRRLAKAVVTVLAVVVGVASTIQIYRIGDSGARSVWGNEIAHLKQVTKK
ncbi:hypothetical protein AO501_22570 [Mycobacterium gordonae]|uniref:DUF2231 domain-containing protein n=1 Tax=Mycobacterium gordonae TaxID=1778 RepID=A0A0Q2XFF8_MYCGO|nr:MULTISPECIES: DUF2231 domain-containing protein [Mycobacterium]KQH79948.1 hypothetical protein AO501_22570 [Mycobacterium gordonae]MDP7727671.1 hypothetical protein [Mycobacterium sp. TY813]